MTLTAAQVKTAVLIGKYGGCLPACENGTMITGSFNLICTGVGIRGGKGTPKGIVRKGQIDHYIYNVPVAKNTLIVDGETVVEYIPTKYIFIKSLPKVAKPDVEEKEELQIFKYDSKGGVWEIEGESEIETLDFTNFVLTQDDELLIMDLLSTNHISIIPIEPFETSHINRLYADDLELLTTLEIL